MVDESRIQELKDSIAEGELIFRAGGINDREMSVDELAAVQRSIDSSKGKLEVLLKQAGFHGFPIDEPVGRKFKDMRDQEGGYFYSHEAGDPQRGTLSEGPESKGRAQRHTNEEARFVQLGLPDSMVLNYDKRDDEQRRSQSEGFYSKEGMKMDKAVILSVLRSDAVLYRSVLINTYRRLHNAFGGDPKAIRDKLISLFPKDEDAIDKFLADSGKNNELIREVTTDPTKQIKELASKVERLGYKKLSERLLKSIKE